MSLEFAPPSGQEPSETAARIFQDAPASDAAPQLWGLPSDALIRELMAILDDEV